MKRSLTMLALGGLALGAAIKLRRMRATDSARVEALDEQFHAAYGGIRDAASKADPVLVLFGETLVLSNGERRSEFAASSPATPIIKAAAHLPIGIYATLQACAALDELSLRRLASLRASQDRARDAAAALDASIRSDVEAVFERSDAFLAHVIAHERSDADAFSRFAAEIAPLLLRLTEHATRLELDALHAAVEAALRELSADEQTRLEVVVAGAHQARAQSLPLQYFRTRLGEAPGEERRVAYAEAAVDPAQAHELVGTRRLDRAIALAFFGDATRLQRDVLGDAASRLLERVSLSRIG